MTDNVLEYVTPSSLSAGPGRALRKLSKGVALPLAPCRGLLVGTAGTANITDCTGEDLDDVPLQAGWNPFGIKALRAGGSADDIWAIY